MCEEPAALCIYVQERTRSALLETLYEELHVNSQCMMGLGGEDEKLENGGGGGGGGFFESFKVSLSVCEFKCVSFLKLSVSEEEIFFLFTFTSCYLLIILYPPPIFFSVVQRKVY